MTTLYAVIEGRHINHVLYGGDTQCFGLCAKMRNTKNTIDIHGVPQGRLCYNCKIRLEARIAGLACDQCGSTRVYISRNKNRPDRLTCEDCGRRAIHHGR